MINIKKTDPYVGQFLYKSTTIHILLWPLS